MLAPLIFAMVLLMGMLVYYTQRQYEREKELAELKSTQKELLERDYRRLNEIYAGNARLFHDFHNHMTILGQLLREGKQRRHPLIWRTYRGLSRGLPKQYGPGMKPWIT